MRNDPGHRLFYGDNLDILRGHIEDESVDLVYLDPPFNSNAGYNVLFRTANGSSADASIEAFDDTWTWGEAAKHALLDIASGTNRPLAVMMEAMRQALGENPLMAYLSMMAVRLVELHRVLKPTGSLYLHCDPTASHYLKLVLDAVFGTANFRNELIWKRTSAHGNVSARYGDVTDTILFYSKGSSPTWSKPMSPLSAKTIAEKYTLTGEDGRRYTTRDLRNPGRRPNLRYPYTASNGKTYQPHPNGWTFSREKMRDADAAGLLHFPRNDDGRLRLKL